MIFVRRMAGLDAYISILKKAEVKAIKVFCLTKIEYGFDKFGIIELLNFSSMNLSTHFF